MTTAEINTKINFLELLILEENKKANINKIIASKKLVLKIDLFITSVIIIGSILIAATF